MTHRYSIVYFSTVPWEFIHQRMHALCSEFGGRGHDVYFVEPIFSKGLRTSFNHSKFSFSFPDETFGKLPAPGVHEIIIPRRITFGPLNFGPPFVYYLKSRWLVKMVAEIRRRSACPVVLIYSSPIFSDVALRARGDFTAFDFIDDPDILSAQISQKEYDRREREMVNACDCVLVTADSLADYVKERHPRARIESLPNGVDFNWFTKTAAAAEVPNELKSVPRPIAGFTGALYEWIDVPMLIHAAKSRPDVSFVFVGYRDVNAIFDELVSLPNVHYFKEKPYGEIPAWVNAFDVCLIPFAPGRTARFTNPKKLYEYLSLGKPTIVTAHLTETEKLGDILYRAEGAEGFLNCLDKSLSESDTDLVHRRIAFAGANSWKARADKMESLIVNQRGEIKSVPSATADSACPLCGAANSRLVLTGVDRNQRLGGTFNLVRCVNCGVERVDPMPVVETLKRHYPPQYYPQDPDMILNDPVNRAYQDVKIQLVGKYTKPGRILDVGTGTRGLLKFFADAGWEAVGTEFSEVAADFSRKSWGLDVRSGLLEEQNFEPESFDAVTFWHVLEHLSNPASALRESLRILKKGGILVVALPNRGSLQAKIFGANWYHLDLPRHIYHFTTKTAVNLIGRTGFELIGVSHRSKEHNWVGWKFSLIPPDPETRKKVPWIYRKTWARLSRILAGMEEMIGRGGTFTLIARRA